MIHSHFYRQYWSDHLTCYSTVIKIYCKGTDNSVSVIDCSLPAGLLLFWGRVGETSPPSLSLSEDALSELSEELDEDNSISPERKKERNSFFSIVKLYLETKAWYQQGGWDIPDINHMSFFPILTKLRPDNKSSRSTDSYKYVSLFLLRCIICAGSCQ